MTAGSARGHHEQRMALLVWLQNAAAVDPP
jgi:hypothetical protein